MTRDEQTPIKTHYFRFNPRDNAGEAMSLKTSFYWNGEVDGIFWNQELTLQSYQNSTTLSLYGAAISPEDLRQLADEMESALQEAKHQTRISLSKSDHIDPQN